MKVAVSSPEGQRAVTRTSEEKANLGLYTARRIHALHNPGAPLLTLKEFQASLDAQP